MNRREFMKKLISGALTAGAVASIPGLTVLAQATGRQYRAISIRDDGRHMSCVAVSEDGPHLSCLMPDVVYTEGRLIDIDPDIIGWDQSYRELVGSDGTVRFFPGESWKILTDQRPPEGENELLNLGWFQEV